MASGSEAAAAQPAGPAAPRLQQRRGPTLPQLNAAIQACDHEALKRLLAQGLLPKVPLLGDFGDPICFSYDGSDGSDFYDTKPMQDPFYTLLQSGGQQDNRVAMCEALLAAGCRPTVYPGVGFEARAPRDGEFLDRLVLTKFNILFDWGRPDVVKVLESFQRYMPAPVAAVELDGPSRLLVMLIKGEQWSPADHQHYPPAFRDAVRTLLLAHHRTGTAVAGRSARGAAAKAEFCPLSLLEPECLMAVVRHLAAPPLTPWLFKQPWGTVVVPDREALYAGMEVWDDDEYYEDDLGFMWKRA